VVALLCGGDYDGGGGAGMVGPRQAFAIVRKLIADARKVSLCCSYPRWNLHVA
jgi:hypothetical protein